jgi:hypothetical protein
VTGVEALRELRPTPRVFVAATGAGAGIQAELWRVPGSSAFLVGAAFPYAEHETTKLLGFTPAKFCDEDAAVQLAIAAYLRAREAAIAEGAKGPDTTALGLGLTASVASLAPHRGDHRVFAATVTEYGATVWSARLSKGSGEAQRTTDGVLADRLGVHAILVAAGVVNRDELAPGLDVVRRELLESEMRALLYRHPLFGPAGSLDSPVLLPGSFDPCHEGHVMIADSVERHAGRRVVYAITANPVHKPSLRAVDLLDRVASIRAKDARPVLLTRDDPLFIDKARQFPGAGIAFGVDAVLRMLDPSWGPDVGEMLQTFRALGTGFYVVGRVVNGRWTTIDDLAIPDAFRDLFQPIEGRQDISSTALRDLHSIRAVRDLST